ncbi:glycosyltransferase [Paludibacter jiangxiensis]|uniref:Glycosyltransferase n=2 Tax=Paludibacter jiangxiensis TaxID=681398 RepID=A0A161LVG6_9BACT|nr:glycosyltransferase [Paludibacter jiangxiensis]
MTSKIAVTVIVPVKNEEVNLPGCLDKLDGFEQLIVIDSGSTDRTPEIAKEYGAEYVNFQWNGQFPKKRNWALRNLKIRNEWVLFVDADEYLTPEFIEELKVKIQDPTKNGYWVVFKNYFMGKQLNHGYEFKKLPLIRKGKGEYEKIDEDSWSHLDMEVHEHPIVEGETGQFQEAILHNDYKGLEHYIARHNAYSTWEARRFLHLEKEGFSKMTFHQKIKYNLMKTPFLPVIYFFGAYILMRGFMDGRAGFYIALYKAHYFFQIKTKIEEFRKTK